MRALLDGIGGPSAARIGGPVFWGALIISLSMGLLAAYPVNVLLIRFGVKEGMHNPKHMMEHQGHH